MTYSYEYPRPALTVDVVVLSLYQGRRRVLLVKRGSPPFAGSWALPGGFLDLDERLEAAARRELKEETQLVVDELTLVGVFDTPDRDPRERVISAVYRAWLDDPGASVAAGSDAAEVRWFYLDKLPTLAFDHAEIMRAATEADA